MTAEFPDFDKIPDANSIELRRLLVELTLRKMESLKIYRPLPFQQSFHESIAAERIIFGGNRAGKTTACSVEIARATTRQDPLNRYPETGICYVVGKSGKEVYQKLFPSLFRPGAFRMVKDGDTKEWRAFDPDRDDVKDAKPAPALVPKRFVKAVAWTSKKLNWPSMVRLTTGWVIYYYTSEGLPTRGTDVDLVHFDEEIINSEWYSECAARLIDRRGRFFWSATPQEGTDRLYALTERAAKQVEDDVQPRTIEAFFSTFDNNKHISAIDKKLFAEKMMDDELAYRSRVLGEHTRIAGRVYPEFSPRAHEVEAHPIPPEWTRYAAIDPGAQVCAVLFGACPPPDDGDFFDIYDELYLKGCSAAKFGYEMGKRCDGQTFHAFIIDMHEARKRDTGSGRKIIEQYSEQLKANRVKSTLTSHGFIPGYDNLAAGIELVRQCLLIRRDGTAKLRIHKNCVNFINEIKYYRNKSITVNGVREFVDQPVKSRDHLCDSARYLISYGPAWVPPKKREAAASPAYAGWLKRQKEAQKKAGPLILGPGGSHGNARDEASAW